MAEVNPFLTPLGAFVGNTAHSNGDAGIRTYPHGLRPRLPDDVIHLHVTDSVTINASVFADNGWAVHMNQVAGVTLANSVIVGLSNNTGNPQGCGAATDAARRGADCRPAATCVGLPLPDGQAGRSTGGQSAAFPSIGVNLDQSLWDEAGAAPNAVVNVSFAAFDPACRPAAAIALSGSGDLWNAAHYVQGLTFATAATTNALWVVPRLANLTGDGTVEDGGEVAAAYALRDLDGSLLGAPGYAAANSSALVSPIAAQCVPVPAWDAYACTGACFRGIAVTYPEPGFGPRSGRTHGDYSWLEILRLEDGALIWLDGNLNEVAAAVPPLLRLYSATLLAGYTYLLTIKGAQSPITAITIKYTDGTGCGQGLALRLANLGGVGWNVTSTDSVFCNSCQAPAPVLSPTSTSAWQSRPVNNLDSAAWSYVCYPGGKVAVIHVDVGGHLLDDINFAALPASSRCQQSSQCGVFSSGSGNWSCTTELDSATDFSNPLTNTSSWTIGRGLFGYNTPQVVTVLPPPSPALITYYFQRTFEAANSKCITQLVFEAIVDDAMIVCLNGYEAFRSNLPSGNISSVTKAIYAASPYAYGIYQYTTFAISLGPTSSPFLVESTNVLAVEVHAYSTNPQWSISFDMRLSLIRNRAGCYGARVTKEVCDGVDNDNDGLVDEQSNGDPLLQPCSTACGTGTEKCVQAIWQQCTAPESSPEICDGLDNDCDGLVDNGLGQLDCQGGSVCFSGRCQALAPYTYHDPSLRAGSPGWLYLHQSSASASLSDATWTTVDPTSGPRTTSAGPWLEGRAPLGYDKSNATADAEFATLLPDPPGNWATQYLLNSFVLSLADVARTQSLSIAVKRDDGAVIYVNGREVCRSNMPAGRITSETLASTKTYTSYQKSKFYLCQDVVKPTLQAGVNVVAAELHQASLKSQDAAFDLLLLRNVFVACPTQSCVRALPADTYFVQKGSRWRTFDTSKGTLPQGWTLPSFDDSLWVLGQAPLGFGWGGVNTTITNPGSQLTSFYFRQAFYPTSPGCYFQLTATLTAADAAVVYLSGLEAYRTPNMPKGAVYPNTTASNLGYPSPTATVLSGGWLLPGKNVVAGEVHLWYQQAPTLAFDLELRGTREGILGQCFT
eukprot:SM000070S21363  [mRNA]  locus=s70:541524:548134:- [translate_table: standard]